MTIRMLPRTRNWVLIEETARRNPDVKKTTPVALSHERFFPRDRVPLSSAVYAGT